MSINTLFLLPPFFLFLLQIYPFRYSYWHKLLPLLLTGECDEVEEIRVLAVSEFHKVNSPTTTTTPGPHFPHNNNRMFIFSHLFIFSRHYLTHQTLSHLLLQLLPQGRRTVRKRERGRAQRAHGLRAAVIRAAGLSRHRVQQHLQDHSGAGEGCDRLECALSQVNVCVVGRGGEIVCVCVCVVCVCVCVCVFCVCVCCVCCVCVCVYVAVKNSTHFFTCHILPSPIADKPSPCSPCWCDTRAATSPCTSRRFFWRFIASCRTRNLIFLNL